MADARVPSLRSRDKTNQQPQITDLHIPKQKTAPKQKTEPGQQLRPDQKIEVRRSQRRRRTVAARMEGDTLVVMIPARMTRAEEKHWVAKMQHKLLLVEGQRASPPRASDQALLARCAVLAEKYLDGDATPSSVRWVPPMRTRWASCTPVDATIRVSERLRDVPSWVLDYVLVHELAHLQVTEHNARFWALVHRYPKAERAIGYLEGLSAAAGLEIGED